MTMLYNVDRMLRSQLSDHAFLATVNAVSGNRIKVVRPGQAAADSTFYAAAAGLAATVIVGDTVLVQRAGAGWVVVIKVTT